MKISGWHTDQSDVWLETTEGMIRIRSARPDAVRVTYTRADHFQNQLNPIFAREKEPGTVRLEADQGERLLFRAGHIRVAAQKATGALSYYGLDGGLLVREPDRGGKTLEPTDVIHTVYDDAGPVQVSQSVDGMRVNAADTREVVDRTAFHTKLELEFADGEALFGLGSHEEGVLNLRGHSQYLYQQNLKATVPVLLSTRGYGLLYASCSFMTFHDDQYGSYIWSDADDEMDFYIMAGKTFDRVIHVYRELTGPAPLFPRWAFGYFQSKERYCSQQELIDTVREYRRRGIPIDVVVQDWQYWPEKQWGQKQFDPARYPDPSAMTADIHAMHARLMISIWPNMAVGSADQREMKAAGFLFGNQSTYDAFNPDARALYWKQAQRGLFDHGVDAWWCDSTEPFEDDWKGAVKPEPEQRAMRNARRQKRYMDAGRINAYSLFHSRGVYEGQRAATDAKRVVNLTRSAYAGQHRYATVTWSGDVSASFETLRRQIAAGVNFCAAGEPYWSTDIGAFFVKHRDDLWFWDGQYERGSEDPAYRELYLRWFQFGAFLPMFRSHGTDTPREIWRFGQPGNTVYDTLVQFIRLRYRLLPYVYSLAAMVTFEGYTMMRALAFDFPTDPEAVTQKGEYMFGPAFLAAPVTHPVGGAGADPTEPVYLPAGRDWYDFWTGRRFPGGQEVQADAGLERMPLFVPAGTLLPLGPQVSYADEKPDAPIELRVYPGADGRFVLYEDEGDGYRYEHGLFAKTLIRWSDAARTLHMERTGWYQGMPEARIYRIVLVGSGRGTGAGETRPYDKEIEFHGEAADFFLPWE